MNHLQRFVTDVLQYETDRKRIYEHKRKLLYNLADTHEHNCRVSKWSLNGLKKTKLGYQKEYIIVPHMLNSDIKEVTTNVKVHQQKHDEAFKELQQVKRIQRELQEKIAIVQQQVNEIRRNLLELNNVPDGIQKKGLTPERIQKFHHFAADESMVGDRCVVCLDDIDVGRKMIRLDCSGQHQLCKVCVENWFASNNTCPLCRHVFK